MSKIKEMGNFLDDDKLTTQEFYNEAVDKNPCNLEDVPDHLKSSEMCIKVVEKVPNCFKYVPDHLKSLEMCIKAVEKNPCNLEDVPDHLKSSEMCIKAVEKSSRCLRAVPDEFITQAICDKAIIKAYNIMYIPDQFKSEEMCNKVVREYNGYIRYVPDHFKIEEISDSKELKVSNCFCCEIEEMVERVEYYQGIIDEYYTRLDMIRRRNQQNHEIMEVENEIRVLKKKRDKLVNRIQNGLENGWYYFLKGISTGRNVPIDFRDGERLDSIEFQEASDWEYDPDEE